MKAKLLTDKPIWFNKKYSILKEGEIVEVVDNNRLDGLVLVSAGKLGRVFIRENEILIIN